MTSIWVVLFTVLYTSKLTEYRPGESTRYAGLEVSRSREQIYSWWEAKCSWFCHNFVYKSIDQKQKHCEILKMLLVVKLLFQALTVIVVKSVQALKYPRINTYLEQVKIPTRDLFRHTVYVAWNCPVRHTQRSLMNINDFRVCVRVSSDKYR